MKSLMNALLLALVAIAYGLWFGLRLLCLPLVWLYRRR
jgi:hypothetical protein